MEKLKILGDIKPISVTAIVPEILDYREEIIGNSKMIYVNTNAKKGYSMYDFYSQELLASTNQPVSDHLTELDLNTQYYLIANW